MLIYDLLFAQISKRLKQPEIHRGHGKIPGEIQRGSRWSTLRWRTDGSRPVRLLRWPKGPKMHGTLGWNTWGKSQKPEKLICEHWKWCTDLWLPRSPRCFTRHAPCDSRVSLPVSPHVAALPGSVRTWSAKTLSTRETWHQTIAGVSARRIPRGIEVSKSQPLLTSVQSFVQRPPLKSWNLHF
jgi:hypothetical protein